MPHDPYKALYIHVPFCASRCAYCDFTTQKIKRGSRQIDRYFEYLIGQIRRLSKEGELSDIETVFIGGGTPTHAGNKNLTQLLYALSTQMDLSSDVECTIEANPESIDERLIADVWALGANRISIGVQSFDDEMLKKIGRIHSGSEAFEAIKIAQTRFQNINIDLMCGLPGQSRKQFADSVLTALDAGVTHVSVYPLTIESGTLFDKQMRKNTLELPSDDEVADMMLDVSRILGERGFYRYEVSNYAKPGFECRHNSAYWSGIPYIGIGDSATTMTQNSERRMRVKDGVVVDDLTAPEMAAEDLMLVMRMARGVADETLDSASILLPDAPSKFNQLEKKGLIFHENGRWMPTERGWLLGNELYGEILDLAD